MARKPSPAETRLRAALKPFFDSNPDAETVQIKGETTEYGIGNPWDDPSVIFLIPTTKSEKSKLLTALNSSLLPPRLSAIFHKEDRLLEIIFTARPLSENLKQLVDRAFEFYYDGVVVKCDFSKSTDKLITIAKWSRFPEHSDYGFRNLISFTQYANSPKNGAGNSIQKTGTPYSFFIRGIDWDEENSLTLIRHVSFYLRYFDGISPYILIHPPTDKTAVKPKTRYPHGKFPDKISSRSLNPILLSFWMASVDAAPENKFLYCYRIIEFVASNYLKGEKLNQVKRILHRPSLLSSVDNVIDELVGLIREDKPETVNRFKAVVCDLADKDLVWQEICANPQGFTQDTEFEGGFKIPKVVDGVDNISKLGPTVMQAIAGQFRDIRNALAHGGEAQAGRVILPTAKNMKMLQPWVHLIVAVAGEVVLHENHT